MAKNPDKPADQGPDVPEHPLIKAMRENPSNPTGAVVLYGYPGRPSGADTVRLYLGLNYQAYIEIPKSAVLESGPSDPAVATSPTRVTVASDASIEVVQVVQASFLQGTIASAYSIAAAACATETPAPPPTTTHYHPRLPDTRFHLGYTIVQILMGLGVSPTLTLIHEKPINTLLHITLPSR